MANLIIGHTTEKSARIWIRGGNHSCVAKISIHTGENKEKTQSHSIDLVPDNDYTAVVSFEGLTADTHYTVRVCFASTRGGLGTSGATFQVQGGFRTFPDLQQGQPRPFSFLLGSCNLSIFTINSFLALLLGLVGRTAMTRSLKRPIDKWDMDFPKGRWWTFFLKRFPGTFRCLSKIAITYGVGFVAMATKGKQPGKPMLKSPFLKLCSLFHLWKIDFDSGKNEPLIGRTITGHDSRATGVLTFSPILETGSWKSGNNGPGDAKGGFYLTHVRGKFQAGEDLKVEDKIIARSTSQAEEVVEKWSIGFQCGEKEPSVSDIITGSESGAAGVLADPANKHSGSWLDKTAAGCLTLIQLEGTFRRGEVMKVKEKVIGKSKSLAIKFPFDYQKPAFVLHAGDQIYFDFPYRERRPELEAYRRTYREAWSEDESLQYFLAQYPHYMTLDDHEIYDQFAKDGDAPLQNLKPEHYLKPAEQAYREYVHARHPGGFGSHSLYYTFYYGAVHYFVLNTRTERYVRREQMIEDDQMICFLDWLEAHKEDLKFVVSSVPFVAEVRPRSGRNATQSEAENEATSSPKAQSKLSQNRKLGENDDKWSSPSYREQREKIIEFVYAKRIKRLVFLVGDMHCSYYATMQIGKGRNYECSNLHELAGGPFHQLQLARQEQFENLTERTFKTQDGGEEIPYKSRLDRFYGGANACMHVTVEYRPKRDVDTSIKEWNPEIEWKVIRPLTESEPVNQGGLPRDSPAMSGRIRFVERDHV